MADAASRRAPGHKHEPVGVDASGVSLAASVAAAVAVIVALAVYAMAHHLGGRHPLPANPTAAQTRNSFPAPRLEPAPEAGIAALHAEKSALLNGYRWVDKERGVVQIPIERAMEVLVAKPSTDHR